MRTGRRADGSRRLRSSAAGALLAALALGVGACSGPPSHDPQPVDWDDNSGKQRTVAQPPDDAGDNDDGGGGEGGGGSQGIPQVELCSALPASTVQQAFGAQDEPSAEAAEETAGLPGLSAVGGCTWDWGDDSLTVTVAGGESSDDAATYLETLASEAGLSGDSVDGLGDASLLDTTGSVQEDAAVGVGVADLEETKAVVVLIGPVDADPSAYAELGAEVLESVG